MARSGPHREVGPEGSAITSLSSTADLSPCADALGHAADLSPCADPQGPTLTGPLRRRVGLAGTPWTGASFLQALPAAPCQSSAVVEAHRPL